MNMPLDPLPVISEKEPFLRFVVDSKFKVYRRILLFGFLTFLLVGENTKHEFSDQTFMLLKMGGFLIAVVLISINIYILVPVFLFKGRYVWYAVWVFTIILLSFAFFTFLKTWLPTLRIRPDEPISMDDNFWGDFMAITIMMGVLCAATTALKLFQRWIRDNYRIMQLENIRMHTELDLLKSQVNPHFLFNMLNNSQVLIQTDPEKASQILVKLSDLLRYQLYDSSRQEVLLSAEILFLVHFLSLEKTRRDYFEFEVRQEGTDEQVLLAPLLFIPFVENAIKHNIQSVNGAYVHLRFRLSKRVLIFECTNPKPLGRLEEGGSGGLGLPNVKRRLELLYPGRHHLMIGDYADRYHVCLTLNL